MEAAKKREEYGIVDNGDAEARKFIKL